MENINNLNENELIFNLNKVVKNQGNKQPINNLSIDNQKKEKPKTL